MDHCDGHYKLIFSTFEIRYIALTHGVQNALTLNSAEKNVTVSAAAACINIRITKK